MSKIKSRLPENFSVLQGDELDGTPDILDAIPDEVYKEALIDQAERLKENE